MTGSEAVTLLDTRRISAVVLDADGVLTDCLPLRTTAWRDTLHAFAAQYARVTGDAQSPLDASADLPAHLTGLLDEDIAATLLRPHTRRVDLAADHLGPAEADLRRILARHEDQRFTELLDSDSPVARPGVHRFLLDLQDADITAAALSSGRHCRRMLRRAGLDQLVEVCVDAQDTEHYGLAGPPNPALLQFALRLLHTRPERAVLFADTPAVLETGERSGFALIIAVDHREAERARLLSGHEPLVHGLDQVEVRTGRPIPLGL
ncbi:HAD family hydrolase [Kitasatospora sp. GP82]|uniref:HAD family hydrolase n=1 Tax=Kitasatospora sp. GP82 TaxID=3035089 RepID=UPI00247323D5|nr:HAD family hydrolase [Kitasatospora sp. GP82]MDH6127308.1 beta-phosphoglucomutase-like phosphatase (HAD superfamily) [Kitasatospora sp. GP82]